MTTVEIILIVVGAIVSIFSGFILYSHSTPPDLAVFGFIGGSILIILVVAFYMAETTEYEDVEYLIVIEDKDTSSHFVGVPGKGGHSETDYYIYFNHKEEKLEVNRQLYDNYNIGDTIIINKRITYDIDRNTKERLNIHSISYNQK